MSTKRRYSTAERRRITLEHGLVLAEQHGYGSLTSGQVAERMGVTGSAVRYHFESVDELKQAVLDFAISRRCWPVIAQGLAAKNPAAVGLPDDVKKKAVSSLL